MSHRLPTPEDGVSCCQDVHAPTRSPFERAVVFDYYDGPLSGICRCTACGKDYAFNVVSRFDDEDEERYVLHSIVRFSPLADGSFERVLEICRPLLGADPPSDCWLPPHWDFGSREASDEASRRVDDLLSGAEPSVLALHLDGTGPHGEVLNSLALPAQDMLEFFRSASGLPFLDDPYGIGKL